MKTPRETALCVLFKWSTAGAYLNIAYKNALSDGFSAQDAAFIKELVFGTVKYKITLDYAIDRFSSVKLKKISPYILNILRMSIYQIFFMDKIPSSAAVNEGVKLARKYGHTGSVAYVNAMLRKISQLSELPYPEKNKDKTEYLSVVYSHTKELVMFFEKNYGERCEEILKENIKKPPVVLRTNTLKTTRSKLCEMLKNEGFSVSEGLYAPHSLKIQSGNIADTALYKDGFFTIQDQASQLSALCLGAKQGDKVFDMCAAPGGKTTYIAELMKNKGKIFAFDIYDKRLKDITVSAKRLGISIIDVSCRDAAEYDKSLDASADRILLDVPCSGLGVLRRRPDIKYKENLTDTSELARLQSKILSTASRYLKPGGTLVYSTCTLNPAENGDIINAFLSTNSNFSHYPISDGELPEKAAEVLKSTGGIFFPGETDGFFICRLKKKES